MGIGMTNLPTGTITLLFTDIEGSTRLLHSLGPAYQDALATHRKLLRGPFGPPCLCPLRLTRVGGTLKRTWMRDKPRDF
jgi:hypothetical protein